MIAADYLVYMTRLVCGTNVTSSPTTNCSGGGGGCSLDGPEPLTADCTLFDFMLWTVLGGTLCAFGLVGNALSFVVLHFGGDNSSKTAATTLLLRALAVADSLVLVTYLPLYALESVTVYTGHDGVFRRFYNVIMPYLWPLYLMRSCLFKVQKLYFFSEKSCESLHKEEGL